MAEAGLYTWVLISKYVDHLPLYRIEQIAARSGVILQRSTLSKWVGKIGLALEPLYKRLIELLLTSTILHIDETPVRQLNPGSGKTVKAWLWGYRTGTLGGAPPITVFDYQNSRKGECVRDFIGNWSGALMVDDYGAYKQLFGGLTERTELGCMAHARRKFVDLYEAIKSPIAAEAIQRIAKLYAIEKMIDGCSIEERARVREQMARPQLKVLHIWMQKQRLQVVDNTPLAKALDYSLKRWPALERYAENGIWPIDNNPIEHAFRTVAVGKKNWLFAGSATAGVHAATIQSLFATCPRQRY